jgi:hypothetical protein
MSRGGRAAGWVRALLVAVVAACIVVTIVETVRRAPDVEWQLSPVWLLAAIAGLAVMQVIHAETWTRLVRRLGSPLEGPTGRGIWNITLLGRYVPTSALMAIGRVVLSRRAGVPNRVGVASIVYELTLQLTAALAVSSALVLTLPSLEGRPIRWLVVALPVLALVALHPRIFGPVSARLLRVAGQPPLERVLPPGTVLTACAAYAVSFLAAGVAVLALAESLAEVDAADVPIALCAYAFGFGAGVLAFVIPGGVGAREAATALALTPVVGFTVGVAAAVGVRLVQIAVELAFAAFSSHGLRAALGRVRELRERGAESV